MPGQPPKRSDQRRRNNPPRVPIKNAVAHKSAPPPASADWHPTARRWYRALIRSGQSEFYEPSDWMTAYVVAENLSRGLKPRYVAMTVHEDGSHTPFITTVPISGTDLGAVLRAMSSLCVMEGDRRRAGIELIGEKIDADEVAAADELEAFKSRRKNA